MKNKNFKTLIYLLYLVIVSAVCAELIGRLFFISDGNSLYQKKERLFIEDKELSYTLKPNTRIDGSINKLYPGVSLFIGSHGLRMPEFDGRSKIILLGDSVAFGFGLNYEETISSQLEEMIGGKHQIVNAGVPGYNFDQWEKFGIRLAKTLNPDLVVVLVNANDFKTIYFPIRGGATVTRTKTYPWDDTSSADESNIPRETLNHSILMGLIRNVKKNGLHINGLTASPAVLKDDYEALFKGELREIKFWNSKDPWVIKRFEDASQSMNKFSKQLNADGRGVVFVFLPYRVSAIAPKIGIDDRFELLANSIKTGPKVGIIELQSILNDNINFLPSDSHTSAQGNMIIAKAIAEKIKPMLAK
jgi:lysophospholipase L1-like esterase